MQETDLAGIKAKDPKKMKCRRLVTGVPVMKLERKNILNKTYGQTKLPAAFQTPHFHSNF